MPLDSLLSAARSMMREDVDVDVDEDEEIDVVGDSTVNMAGTRHARPRDMLGSPVPKRRKVAARTDKLTELTSRATNNASASSVNTSEATNTGAGRVRSALDVLADQAAAFSTPFQMQTQTQTKGKGKERVDQRRGRPPRTGTSSFRRVGACNVDKGTHLGGCQVWAKMGLGAEGIAFEGVLPSAAAKLGESPLAVLPSLPRRCPLTFRIR